MNRQYNLSKQVTVRVLPERGGDPIEGRLTAFSRPLTQFQIIAPVPPVKGRFRFEFVLHELPLMSGRGRARGHSGESAREDAWEWQVHDLQLAVDDEAAGLRLSPLLPADARPDYGDQPYPSHPDGQWARWIDFHSRAILLLDLLADINSEMDPQALLLSIMEAARRIMEAEASSLMLLDKETGELMVKVPTGPARSEITGIRIPAGRGFAGWVAEKKQPLIVDSPLEDPRFYGEIAGSGFRTRNLICVPLESGSGEVIGVLQAMNRLGEGTFRPDEIPLFSALAQQAAIALERDRLIKESIRRQVLERELTLASEIQAGFWPRELPTPEGVQIAGSSRPAAHVGGDYYDVIRLDDDHIGLVVADVSGKGVPAALLMAAVRSSLRTQLENQHAPGEAVSRVNNALVGDSPTAKFVTLFFGVLDLGRRRLTYVNAGHNPPILWNPRDGRLDRLEVGGPIIGFRSNLPYESGEIDLEPGHQLVMFSDGITEAQNQTEEMFGDELLLDLIRHSRESEAEGLEREILKAVQDFCGPAKQADDMTLLIVTLN